MFTALKALNPSQAAGQQARIALMTRSAPLTASWDQIVGDMKTPGQATRVPPSTSANKLTYKTRQYLVATLDYVTLWTANDKWIPGTKWGMIKRRFKYGPPTARSQSAKEILARMSSRNDKRDALMLYECLTTMFATWENLGKKNLGEVSTEQLQSFDDMNQVQDVSETYFPNSGYAEKDPFSGVRTASRISGIHRTGSTTFGRNRSSSSISRNASDAFPGSTGTLPVGSQANMNQQFNQQNGSQQLQSTADDMLMSRTMTGGNYTGTTI